MHSLFHNRLSLTCWTYATLAGFLVWSMAAIVPPAAYAAEPPLGLATGSQHAQVSVNGKHWLPLSGSSHPIYEGTMIRTGKGTASVLLKDGSQLELLSKTLVELSGSRTAPVMKIAIGQVLFRVSVPSHASFITPSARYQIQESVSTDRPAVLKVKATDSTATDSVGTIVVNARGGSRLSLQQGAILAKSATDPGLHVIKAGQSLYIPRAGAPDPGFGVMLAQAQALTEETPVTNNSAATDTTGTTENAATSDTQGEQGPPTDTGMDDGTGTVVGVTAGLVLIGAGVGLGVGLSGDDDGKKSSHSTP